MRKYLITLAVMLTALLGAKAQTSPVGTWVYNFSKDNPTNIYGINYSQDGKFTEVENPEGKFTNANLHIEKVDKDFRQQILNNWKNYRSTAK